MNDKLYDLEGKALAQPGDGIERTNPITLEKAQQHYKRNSQFNNNRTGLII